MTAQFVYLFLLNIISRDVYDFQYEASRTNALIESSMAGAWLSVVFWLAGMAVIVVQRCIIGKQKQELDRYKRDIVLI